MGTKKNICANYFGRGWSALMSICFIPLYIYYLGIEAYGLIGFFTSMMVLLGFLEFGLGQTLVRETARSAGIEHEKNDLTDLIGTLEYVYGVIALLFSGAAWFIAEWLGHEWLHTNILPENELINVIQIMGCVAGLAWIGGIYRSGLIGLQEQVWLNVFGASFSTLRGLGVVFVLVWVSPSVKAFFIYQGILSLIEVMWLRYKLWDMVVSNSTYTPKFHLKQLQRIWRFAGAVAINTLLGTGISQLDKLLLPGLVSLKVFGYYMLANALGRSIGQLVYPIAIAYRPVFAKLVSQGSERLVLSREYHKANQIMAVAIVPVAMVLVFFAEPVLWLWTGSREIVNESAQIVSLLALGTMLNGLVNIPYSIQLAYGSLRPAVYINLVAAIILVPSFLIGVKTFGVIAAAWIWLGLNLGYVVVNISVMHRKFLINEGKEWYLKDIMPVICSSSVVAYLLYNCMPMFESKWLISIELLVVAFFVALSALMSAQRVRQFMFNELKRFKSRK